MPPRIIESDEEQDELASASDDSYSYNDSSNKVAPPSRGSRSAPGRQASASARIRVAAPAAVPPARPAARAAAVRANESMDVADVASDEDEGEEVDELADEDDEEQEDEGDDAEGEEYEDYDNDNTSMQEDYPSQQPSPSTSSTAANPVKIKLKLGANDNNGPPSSPAMPPTVISLRGSGRGKGTLAPSSSRGGSKKGKAPAVARPKPAAKRKHSEMEGERVLRTTVWHIC